MQTSVNRLCRMASQAGHTYRRSPPPPAPSDKLHVLWVVHIGCAHSIIFNAAAAFAASVAAKSYMENSCMRTEASGGRVETLLGSNLR
jgi:hypothetical protein